MKIPTEEFYALNNTFQFLCELASPTATPKLPKEIRLKAMQCLKHYPQPVRLEEIYANKGTRL